MIRIKRVKRIAIAVKDLDAAVENWKRLFGIKPFLRGEEPEDRYAFVGFQIGNTRGDGETTIEFLSPINDPNGEMLIGKFIKNRGEGIYMITLETEGTSEEVDAELREIGIEASWGGALKQWSGKGMEYGLKSWTEHYISPKQANGVLITLASIEYADPEVFVGKSGKTIKVK
jgi:hypothetical protein